MLIAAYVGIRLVLTSVAKILVSCCDNSAVIQAVSLCNILPCTATTHQTVAPIASLNIQDNIVGKKQTCALYFFRLFVQFTNLSRPGNYYIHFPYSADLCRKSGIIKNPALIIKPLCFAAITVVHFEI